MTRRQLSERAELVNSIDRLIWKKAWAHWQRLSPIDQMWLDVEDLHQEGLIAAMECYAKWDRTQTKFITYAFVVVENRLRSLTGALRTQKRAHNQQVPLDVVDWEVQRPPLFELIPDAVLQYVYEAALVEQTTT